MEEEIDLRRYVEIVLQYKYWLVGITLLFAVLAFGFTALQPPIYEAEANLAMLRIRSEIALEPKFKTTEEVSDVLARQTTLVALAKSSTVAAAVFQQLGSKLNGQVKDVVILQNLVTVESNSNLIVIKARATTPELAADIANMWGKQAEIYLNTIYMQPSQQLAEIETKSDEAKQDYGKAQTELEKFIATNQIRALNRQISDLQQKRDNLYKRHLSIIDLGLATQFELAKGQSEDYFNTLLTQRQSVTDQQEDRARKLFAYYQERQIALAQLLVDTQALKEQVVNNSSAPGNLGNALAVLSLKMSGLRLMKETKSNQPNLQLTDLQGLSDTPPNYVADLDSFIKQIETEATKTTTQLETLSQELLKGNNYKYGGLTADPSDPLYQAEIKRITDMMELKLLDKVLPEYETRPLYELIKQLDTQIDQLSAKFEAEQARQKGLNSQRDLAWEAYQTVQRKLVELQVSEQAPASEVRFAVQALPPERAMSSRLLINMAGATLIGLLMSLLGVFARDWWKSKK